eukprot:TRINITY_DN53573_c0_g1_i1.p1 TRINITY_DN53573_c0_g1~~TRINITY_DN53573_c0_g1_i1.p1  ORF type:complete len:114 (-),score=10.47 TRINITY_DN53573_c0_g1_i1:13-354(-)
MPPICQSCEGGPIIWMISSSVSVELLAFLHKAICFCDNRHLRAADWSACSTRFFCGLRDAELLETWPIPNQDLIPQNVVVDPVGNVFDKVYRRDITVFSYGSDALNAHPAGLK